MGSNYIKPQKKYISKELVMKNLDLQEKEFDKLVALCQVHPYIPKNNRKVDQGDGFYYRISDANKLVHSDVYKILIKNRKLEDRKKKYLGTGLEYKIENIRHEEYGYVDLIRSRCKGLGEAVDELNHTLGNLYLARMLGLDDRISETLGMFENFIARKSLLECSYMSKAGVYNQTTLGKIRVVWFVPYPGAELKDIVEEKKDLPRKFEWSEPNFLDFVSSSEEEDSESEEMEIIYNDPGKIDISLLSHSVPLLMVHCKLVLFKLEKVYESHNNRKGIFQDVKFYIGSKTIEGSLRLIALSCGGDVVESPCKADIHISEGVDEVMENTIYVQPQYLFDCLNQRRRLSAEDYCVGKELPKHVSPFASIDSIITKENLMTMSKTRRHKIEDLINRFEDVKYEH
ncbi:pescadillo N-terminus domain-containing protein [Encephalitozoon intestinalis ATCC 50506]|uniref:60S ribosomal subunit biogenesis protein n=1 Tax=Encephalitozoon intestinalis (strain ATCC 50506) TaxID=876142 RepID=E0SAA6_ENCIT|nr:pescadillo N-terminus domain-containing protein [Encephalitozoon intestinalis ATCC 50506]ADM12531.1 60S ribosomal subunit biogenesis protein [Encephalitozoon intestinalis ATCC 50506]UTX46384.1 pescadillo N-terminus domain-containing protein [Encephalitozoon intestinalis]